MKIYVCGIPDTIKKSLRIRQQRHAERFFVHLYKQIFQDVVDSFTQAQRGKNLIASRYVLPDVQIL